MKATIFLTLVLVFVWGVASSVPARGMSQPHGRYVAAPERTGSKVVPSGLRNRASIGAFSPSLASEPGEALRIDPAAFSPAIIGAQNAEGTLNASNVGSTFFAPLHSAHYTALGFRDGYYEQGIWAPDSTSQIGFFYAGSEFAGSDAAIQAWTDGMTTVGTEANAVRTDCPLDMGMTCAQITFPSAVTLPTGRHYATARVTYVALLLDQCTAEIAAATDESVYTAHENDVNHILWGSSGLAVHAAAVLKSVCGPPVTVSPTVTVGTTTALPTTSPAITATPRPSGTPSAPSLAFSIISLRVETFTRKADWNQARAAPNTITTGTRIQVSVYFNVTHAPASQPFAVHLVITRAGNTVIDRTLSVNTGCAECRLHSLNPSDAYRLPIGPVRFAKKGTYSLTATLSLGTVESQATTRVKAVPYIAPSAEPTLSFLALGTVNRLHRPTSTFTSPGSVGLAIDYSIRSPHVPEVVSIVRTYQYRGPHGWVPMRAPLATSRRISNGEHRLTVFDRPDRSYSQQRVVVGISSGQSYAERIGVFAFRPR